MGMSGTQPPLEGEAAPPRSCSSGRDAADGGCCLEPISIRGEGWIDGRTNKLVGGGWLAFSPGQFLFLGFGLFLKTRIAFVAEPAVWVGAVQGVVTTAGVGSLKTTRRVFWVCSKTLLCLGTKCLLLPNFILGLRSVLRYFMVAHQRFLGFFHP